MTDYDLHELPDGWTWSKLGYVCSDPQYGWTTSATKKGSLHLLRTTDITSGNIDWTKVPYCKDEPPNYQKYFVKDNDIVISRAGSVGFSYLIKNPPPSVFASYLIRFRSLINEKYFSYFLKSPFYWNSISEKSLGIAVPNVNATKLKEISVPIAPLNEQKRIVLKIEELFKESKTVRESLDKIPQIMKNFRQSVLVTAFSGGLVHQDPNDESAGKMLEKIRNERRKKWTENLKEKGKDPKKFTYNEHKPIETSDELQELPDGWTWSRLNDFCTLQVGFSFKSKDFKSTGVKLLRGANIAPGYVHWSETKYLSMSEAKQYDFLKLFAGDIVIGMDRPIVSSGVKIARVKESDIPSLLVQRVGRFISEGVFPDYVYYLISQTSFSDHLFSLQTGSDLPHVSSNDILSYVVPLAPLEEQKRIVTKIKESFSFADQIEKSVEEAKKRADRMDQAILAKAFRGELVPQDPNDEPASVLLEKIKTERENIMPGTKSKKSKTFASA